MSAMYRYHICVVVLGKNKEWEATFELITKWINCLIVLSFLLKFCKVKNGFFGERC
jgi:hypothetical protein